MAAAVAESTRLFDSGYSNSASQSATSASASNPLARIRALLEASSTSSSTGGQPGGAGSAIGGYASNNGNDVNGSSSSSLAPSQQLYRPRSKTDVSAVQAGSRPHSRNSGSNIMRVQGGIGDSPAASFRSRLNSASSMGSASHARTSSMFTHRQSSSSATQDIVRDYRAKDRDRYGRGAAQAQVSQSQSQSQLPPHQAQNPSGKGTFPSIRNYNTLHDIVRPRTPLMSPRVQAGPPQIGSEEAGPGSSYVASLGMAPLVTRPPQGGEAVYIPGGRAPTPQHLASAFDASPNPANVTGKQSRPMMHQRSSSYNSYLGRNQEPISAQIAAPAHNSRMHTRQNSRATTPRARSRQNSHISGSSSSKGLGSRFIRYDNPIADSPRARRRSSSFGAFTNTPLFSGWSPQALSTPGLAPNCPPDASADGHGRRSRSRSRLQKQGQGSSSSADKRRQARKLVSARLPAHHRDHRDARLPSQPLGITWICGAGLVARDPSFYEDFEYAEYPGGRRKRSLSRSTITPNKYKNSMEASTEGGHVPAGYESEPENLERRRARQASIDQYNRDILAEQQQGGSRPTIQVMSEAEKSLRRKSQSLNNLRQAFDGDRARPHGLFISAPLASTRVPSSSAFVNTPRTAPMPDQSGLPATSSVRRAPSKASLEAMGTAEERKAALLAALPPPNRRSPALQTPSPQLFSTGRVISTTVGQPETSQYGQAFSTEGILDDYTADRSHEASGGLSPGLEDIRDYEASAFILREGNHTPIVYGHAFSGLEDAPESQEGEIIDDTRLSGGMQTLESQRSGLASLGANRSVNDRSFSDRSIAQRSNSSRSIAQSPASHGASASSGSAHILDLNDESFTNLFYKAPPPTKPLPSLPGSDSASGSFTGSGSGSRGYSPMVTRSIPAVAKETVVAEHSEPVESPELQPSPLHSSPREGASHPLVARQASREEWINVDEGLLRGNRDIWQQRAVEADSEDEMEALRPPPRLQRGSTASTYDESDYATAESANASTVALTEGNSQHLHHAPSFLSARSHITAASAAPTIRGDTPGFERTFAFPSVEPAHRDRALEPLDRDPLATLRRTDLSPIYVARPHVGESEAYPSGLTMAASPRENRRDSFIDFDVSTDKPAEAKQSRRASVDNRSFIDDEDSEDEDRLKASSKAEHRPSVIVEHVEGEDEDTVHAQPFGELGVPGSGAPSRDRSSAASHAHSVSNASFLSRLADFPDPPNASASTLDLDPLASSATLVKPSGSSGTIKARPKSGDKPSRTTLSTQNTSVYTFSSSDDGGRTSRLQAPEDRSSFLDTTASPERPVSQITGQGIMKPVTTLSSGHSSPAIASTSASPSTPSFRLSSLFKRPQHQRTYSDPSMARSSVSQYSSRHTSGGSDALDERRQSWRS